MEDIIARKYAIIEKLMYLSEEELAALEVSMAKLVEEDATSVEQYNNELEKAESEIDRGDYVTHEEALKRISRWKKKD